MTNVYDVPAINLINKVADDLKENKKIIMPEWALYVKTGCSRERTPESPNWWCIRMASILRKIYIKGHANVKSLRVYYGGKKNRGVKPERFRKASGKIIRVCLQDLQKLEFVEISEKGGRVLTKKGQSYLDKFSSEIFRELYPDSKPFKTDKVLKSKTSIKEKVSSKKTTKEVTTKDKILKVDTKKEVVESVKKPIVKKETIKKESKVPKASLKKDTEDKEVKDDTKVKVELAKEETKVEDLKKEPETVEKKE